jgi:hypothetical protein
MFTFKYKPYRSFHRFAYPPNFYHVSLSLFFLSSLLSPTFFTLLFLCLHKVFICYTLLLALHNFRNVPLAATFVKLIE